MNRQFCKQLTNFVFDPGSAETATVISFHTFQMYHTWQYTLTLQKLPNQFFITFLDF